MRILIADDEYYARKAMAKKVLQASPDAEIMGDFENGIQVLEYLEEHPDEIDVVLTDVKMPEMDLPFQQLPEAGNGLPVPVLGILLSPSRPGEADGVFPAYCF